MTKWSDGEIVSTKWEKKLDIGGWSIEYKKSIDKNQASFNGMVKGK